MGRLKVSNSTNETVEELVALTVKLQNNRN